MKNNNLNLLTLSTVVLSTFVAVFNCQPSSAEVPQKFIDSLKQNEGSINRCLNFVSSQYLGDNPPATQDGTIDQEAILKIIEEQEEEIKAIHRCFTSVTRNFSNESSVTFRFRNIFHPEDAPIEGTFEVSFADLATKITIKKEDINTFSYNNRCNIENLTEFSFKSSRLLDPLMTIELKYVSEILDKLVKTENASQAIMEMNESLNALLLLNLSREQWWDILYSPSIQGQRLGSMRRLQMFRENAKLIFIDSANTPDLKFKCLVNNQEFSLDSLQREAVLIQEQNARSNTNLVYQERQLFMPDITIRTEYEKQQTTVTYTGFEIAISSHINP